MKFIAYMRCSTCVKAHKHLQSTGLDFDLIDIKENTPSKEEFKKYHELSGLDIKKFFNTSGVTYKELNIKDKLINMTLEEKYELLASNGMLVKRPILVTNENVVLGYKEEIYDEIFKNKG